MIERFFMVLRPCMRPCMKKEENEGENETVFPAELRYLDTLWP